MISLPANENHIHCTANATRPAPSVRRSLRYQRDYGILPFHNLDIHLISEIPTSARAQFLDQADPRWNFHSFGRLRQSLQKLQQSRSLAPRISRRILSASCNHKQDRRVSTCSPTDGKKGTLSTRSYQPLERSMNPKTPNVKRNGSRSKMTNIERQTNLTISGERQEGGCE